MVLVAWSRMAKRKGWSALKEMGGGGGDPTNTADVVTTTPVAAAAWVPVSSTLMKLFWMTALVEREPWEEMPLKSAEEVKASWMPKS